MLLCEREQMRHQDRASSLFSPLLLANWSPLDLVRRIPVLFAITQSIWSKNRNFYCTGKHRMRFTKISCRHIRGNHICYTSRLYRNENSFCEIDVMKEKKKEEKKIDDPFPISLKRQTLRGEKKKLNCESFSPLGHLEYLNHWYFSCYNQTFDIFYAHIHRIDEELIFKAVCACARYLTRALTINIERFRTTDYHHFRPSKLDEIHNFITSIVATLLSNEYIIGYFLFSRIDTNLTIATIFLNIRAIPVPEMWCKIYRSHERLIIFCISIGKKSW